MALRSEGTAESCIRRENCKHCFHQVGIRSLGSPSSPTGFEELLRCCRCGQSENGLHGLYYPMGLQPEGWFRV